MKTTTKLLSLTALAAAAMSFALPAWATDYEWTGNSTDTNWNTDENWSETGWVNGYDSNAYFPYYGEGGDSVGNKEVTISGAIVAGTVTIGDEYTFTVTEEGSLTMTELAPGENPHLTIDGVGTVTIGESSSEAFVLAGTLTIAGSEVTFNVDVDLQGGTMEVTGGKVIFSQTTTTIDGGGTLNISTGDAEFQGGVNLGSSTSGATAGIITIGSVDENGNAIGGTVIFGGDVNIGYSNSSTITILGGTVTFDGAVNIGYSGSTTMTISGGTNTFGDTVTVGQSRKGDLTIEGGTNTFESTVIVGNAAYYTSTMTISGGKNTFNNTVHVGYASSATGTLNIEDGENTFGSVTVGNGGTGNTMTISGGKNTFESSGTVTVGRSSNGTLTITDGENKFSGTLKIGNSTSYVGTMTITGGTTTISGTITFGNSSSNKLTIGGGDDGTTATVYLGTQIGSNSSYGSVEISTNASIILYGDLLASIAELVNSDTGGSVTIIQASSITINGTTLDDSSTDLATIIGSSIYAEGYDLTWEYSSSEGTLSVVAAAATPEPSMFGLFFGLATIGLVATRRRRRR